MIDAQAVWYKGKLYVGGGKAVKPRDSARLYVYTPQSDSWSSFSTPVSQFALAVYNSQLVLVGGRKYNSAEDKLGPATSEILVVPNMGLGRCNLFSKMTHERCGGCAIAIGDILIVTGGEEESSVQDVEIYDGKSWYTIKRPLNLLGGDMKILIYNDSCYLLGGRSGRVVFCISLASLKAICKVGSMYDGDPLVWKRLPDVPEEVAGGCLTTLGNRLLVLNGGMLHAFSPYTYSWVHIQAISYSPLYCMCVVISSTGEMMLLGGKSSPSGTIANTVIKASFDNGMLQVINTLL